jgi:16S rRNA processing protein RimM
MSTASRTDELVELAAVVRAHGLRGEVLLKPFNPESELFSEVKSVVLKLREGGEREFTVTRGHVHGTGIILGLAEVRDRDAADALRGSVVCVRRADFPDLADDEHYLVDLVGLEARDAEGKVVGRVADIVVYPSAACLIVEHDDTQLEVPHTERYVTAIDLDARVVSLANLEELEILRTGKGKA